MQIAGIKKTTLLDYPWKLATIIFTPGCNLRCGFCHNPEFVLPEKVASIQHDLISEDAFFRFLHSRKSTLDGVVICGWEPTLQHDLIDFIRRIKSLGFLVKLDTNGSRPDVIQNLLEDQLIDALAMDIKDAPSHYHRLTHANIPWWKYEQSISLILKSNIMYEFRTTCIRGFHTHDDFHKIGWAIVWAKKYFLQNYQPHHTLELDFSWKSFPHDELLEIQQIMHSYVAQCSLRI